MINKCLLFGCKGISLKKDGSYLLQKRVKFLHKKKFIIRPFLKYLRPKSEQEITKKNLSRTDQNFEFASRHVSEKLNVQKCQKKKPSQERYLPTRC